MSHPLSLFEKIWQQHIVVPETESTPAVLYVDLHLIHEVSSPQSFTQLRDRNLGVRRPDRTLATMDHSTPTLSPGSPGGVPVMTGEQAEQIGALV
ncbi:MAG: aconitase family protein, partial [Gammaproteobacteria bacterium]